VSLVQFLKIPADFGQQRLDNFLAHTFTTIPKSRLYRAIRDGEIRINKKKAVPNTLLQEGDELRIPPFMKGQDIPQTHSKNEPKPKLHKQLEPIVLFENQAFMVISKPSGLAVHGGSGVSFGVIEWFRHHQPHLHFLELVHRIDRDTSGLLLLAKKRSALTALHEQFRLNQIKKHYLALVHGQFSTTQSFPIDLPLYKFLLPNGERRVCTDSDQGKPSHTWITPIAHSADTEVNVSLCISSPKTGRTHQIRAHLRAVGHPIVFDDKYGDRDADKTYATHASKQSQPKRLMLHAWRLSFELAEQRYSFEAPIPQAFLEPVQNTDDTAASQKLDQLRQKQST
jgi:23S rRNA pseudouridine955/2504/2580 synthase